MTSDEIRKYQARALRQFMHESSHLFNRRRVLDFGCGDQPYRAIIEAMGGEYTGFNRGHYPGGPRVDHGPDTPLLDEWDVIVCNQMLQYVLDPHDLIDQFRLALAPEGYLVMTYATNWPEVEPQDLHRFTKTGMDHMLRAWREICLHERIGSLPFGDREELPLGYGVIARA